MWSALVCGFGGMRDPGGDVTFDPRLPEEWERLTYRLTIRGQRVRVEVTADEIAFELEVGERPLDIFVQGTGYTAVPGERLVAPLAKPEKKTD